MSDLIERLRLSAKGSAARFAITGLKAENTDEWQAADLIESQQQRITELEQREAEFVDDNHKVYKAYNELADAYIDVEGQRDELAAHVERLRGAYSYLENDADPHGEIFAILSSTPTTSLNALRREVAKEAFLSGCSDLPPDEEMLKWAGSYINERYPDKEESNETK